MRINKAGYGNLSWIDAVSAAKKQPDPVRSLDQETPEDIENALGRTCQAAFKTPSGEMSSEEAVRLASIEARKNSEFAKDVAAVAEIQEKLAARDIDPVKLGVATREEWANSLDPKWTEEVAKKAVIAFSKLRDKSWEKVSSSSKKTSYAFNEGSRSGQVMSSYSTADETANARSRTAKNSNSILNPHQIHEMAARENEHDASVARIRSGEKTREAERKKSLLRDVPEDAPKDKSGRVFSTAGKEKDAFVHRTPKNQISMLDNLGDAKMSAEEMKTKLANLFTRVDDPRADTKRANEERRESIKADWQKKDNKDRSWEKVERSASTSDLSRRLMSLWMVEPKDE